MKDYLRTTLRSVLDDLSADPDVRGEVPDDFEIELEKPAREEHGDLSTNTAMRLAGVLKNNPRAIAEDIAERMREHVDPERIRAVEVAGPGFINFRFAQDYLFRGLADLLADGDVFGRTGLGTGETAVVEYVSANPTGPLTVGHGRNAVLGDTIANLLEWTGAEVEREYYFNNAGRQMRVLGQSVRARYLQELGHEGELPEGGYEGEYIREIAATIVDEHGDALVDTDDITPFKETAEELIFEEIQSTLKRMNIEMDSFFNEHTLYEDGSIDQVVETFRKKDLAYDKDGAVWFKTTEFEAQPRSIASLLNVSPASNFML